MRIEGVSLAFVFEISAYEGHLIIYCSCRNGTWWTQYESEDATTTSTPADADATTTANADAADANVPATNPVIPAAAADATATTAADAERRATGSSIEGASDGRKFPI